MTLITTLIGIVVDRLVGHLHEYRHYNHFLSYTDWLNSHLPEPVSNSFAGPIVILAPVLLLVGFLQIWLAGTLSGLLGILFSIAVFVYCLGPRDLATDVETYCHISGSSDKSLRDEAAGRITAAATAPEDLGECVASVTRAVLLSANDRMFAVIFWFVLLGPFGAVLYRAVSVLFDQRKTQDAFGDWVSKLHAALIWAPARLTALGYALAGHFDAAIEGWRAAHDTSPSGSAGSDRVVVETGLGALDLREASPPADNSEQPVRSAMRLVWRNLTVWLLVLAVMTLAGWAT